jgi:hypothetical protein
MPGKTRKEIILDTLDDMVSCLLFYDRKEDQELPLGAIEAAIREGEITVEEMVAKFDDALRKGT